jgi:hypothetical protein
MRRIRFSDWLRGREAARKRVARIERAFGPYRRERRATRTRPNFFASMGHPST